MSSVLAQELSERNLQKQVRNMLDQFGWTTAVTWSSLHSPKGWPDIFAVRLNHDASVRKNSGDDGWSLQTTEAVAIELKSERGRVTPEQGAWLDLLRRLPGVKFAGVIRPSQWYAGELDAVLR